MPRPGQQRVDDRGRRSDSAANAWHANPAGRSPDTLVMTVTPVQK
jgi:hypothetical protein